MLVSEKKLSSADGVLLWPADHGVNYQTAGAFQRLGGRLLGATRAGKTPSALPSTLPMKQIDWDPARSPSENFGAKPAFRTLIWAPHPALSWNEAPDTEESQAVLAAVHHATALDPDFHPIFVVPQRSPRDLLLKLQASSPRATILLSPLAFGFRDDSLFDRSLEAFKTRPASLSKIPADPHFSRPLLAVSFADLAAHLVVAPQNESLVGKNIWVHGAEWTLLDWVHEFTTAFPVKAGLLARIGARLSRASVFPPSLVARIFTAPPDDGARESRPISTDFVVHSDSELFPSPPPRLQRSLQQHSKAFERYPELELVFTPGRAL